MTLSAEVQNTVRRLTRAARRAENPAVAATYRTRRDELLTAAGYSARVREDATGTTLVCYPQEWLDDGTVVTDRIDDLDRAIEVSLSGVGDPDNWADIAAANDRVVERVRKQHGSPHDRTAAALAAFASNHYAKPIDALTTAEVEEFKSEYFPRNAWPTDAQRAALEESIQYTRRIAAELPAP